MGQTKAELRQKYKTFRLEMTKAEVQQKSRVICRQLIDDFDWRQIKKVHIYRSINKLNEVDTAPLINELKKRPHIKIVIGRQTASEPAPSQKFDLIVAPVLAFDKNNCRLGWGGGWYDRFLAAQPQALKIGLAYQASLVIDELPREKHDVSLDKIITESRDL